MNCVHVDFYDEVIQRLSKADIERLMFFSGYWSSTAETHFNKRRELGVWLIPNSEGTKVGVQLYSGLTNVPFEIASKYDQITSVHFGQQTTLLWRVETEEQTLEQLRTKTLPMIQSVAAGCFLFVFENASQPFSNIPPSKVRDALFDGLKECSGLSDIVVRNYGEKCHEFPTVLEFNINELRSIYPQFAVIPDKWPFEGSTAFWEIPQTKKKLEVTVPYKQIHVCCH